MNVKELVSQFPDKSFSEKFKEKKNALMGIGVPKEDLENKERELKKIFEYDRMVISVYQKLVNKKNLTLDDRVIDKISFHFNQIKELNQHLESDLNYQNKQDINQLFAGFVEFLRNKGFLDNIHYNVGNRDIISNKSIIDEYINELESIIEKLQLAQLNDKNLKNVEKFLDKILKDKQKYDDAIKIAENWIKLEQESTSFAIQEKINIFDLKADNEHAVKKYRPWLIAGIATGIIMLACIGYFIHELGSAVNITIGTALLRVSSLVVLSYFAFIFLQQFSNHRKLYEFYKFKAIALATMKQLLKTYTNQKEKEMILNKSINIIFSEPNFSDDKHLQQQLIDELLDIIKKKA